VDKRLIFVSRSASALSLYWWERHLACESHAGTFVVSSLSTWFYRKVCGLRFKVGRLKEIAGSVRVTTFCVIWKSRGI